MYMRILAAAVSVLALAAPAQAGVNVSIWTGTPAATAAANNATIAAASGLGTATGTAFVGPINFASPPSAYTIGAFLNNPVFSNATVGGDSVLNTYMLFTGDVFLNAGLNTFSVSHDDGVQLNVDGLGLLVDSPAATSDITNTATFNVLTSGLYSFELSYGECCGPPADLTFALNGTPVRGVPEPATWGMMLLGFAGIGLAMRTRRRLTISQVA
ncbi:MAG TPA: PEPxxWA-CTERM sorting domain-containing protein [Sphingomicrobium sp.]|nr:PEPxxWA-CTERM sorting domain-containing protein [Sphingomicrobium sp.]